MTLTDSKSWQRKQDERARSPTFNLPRTDHNLGHASWEMDQCCASRADVVISVAQGAERSFEEVYADGNTDVDSRIKSCGW